MNIIINGNEYAYQSDYPEGWKFSAGDPFKFPVQIGDQSCFIKRFEQKNPKNISGWELLLKLKGQSEPNLSKIFDIKLETEKGKDIYYIFYEYLDGFTLDKRVRTGEVNLSILTRCLFTAIRSLHKYDFWFADFCEKNIFCKTDGTFVLVDIDSTQRITDMPDNEMYGSKDYWILVFKFYKEILNKTNLNLSDINGISFNFLQIVFLILRLKLYYQTKRKDYNSTDLYNQLPVRLNEASPEIKNIFLKVLQNGRQPISQNEIGQLEILVNEKIVHAGKFSDTPVTVANLPVIKEFKSDKTEIERGGNFVLSWQVENANKLELYKNGAMYRTLEMDRKEISLTGFADGTQQQYTYELVAYKDLSIAKSQTIIVQLKHSIDKKPFIKKRTAIIIGVALLIGLILIVFLTKKPKIEAFVKQNYVWQGIDSTVTILGNHLPYDEDLQVILNDFYATIKEGYEDSLLVSIPPEKITTAENDLVHVFVSYKKKTNAIGTFVLYPPVTLKQKLLFRNSNITFYGRNMNSGSIKVFLNNNEIQIISSSPDSLVAHTGNFESGFRRSVNLTIYDNTKVIFNKNIRVRTFGHGFPGNVLELDTSMINILHP
ncbi:MAG TPA: IPT/TIG domain-containing protein [Bacteroidales bacterium]|jgi:hypothetical protein|nr:IPT/TIG domain-containing protein [Bacteroidales bacterium]